MHCALEITTNVIPPAVPVVFEGPAESPHRQPANVDESAAEEFASRLIRIACEHPQLPLSKILRTELPTVSVGILRQ